MKNLIMILLIGGLCIIFGCTGQQEATKSEVSKS